MKVLVIGSAGYIGSALTKHLSKTYQTTGIDLVHGHNYLSLSSSFYMDYDVIVLLAGVSTVAESKRVGLQEVFDANVNGFVELTQKINGQKLIYASSSSVYGGISRSHKSMETDCQFEPLCTYDASKMMIDIAAQVSDRQYYGLRFGTVCGPSPTKQPHHLTILNAMVKSSITTGTITAINPEVHRPILALSDLCRAVQSIIEGGDHRGIYNLANFNSTVDQLALAVTKYFYHERGKLLDCNTSSGPTMYDFSINSSKFIATYDFKFEETLLSLIDKLVKHYDNDNN